MFKSIRWKFITIYFLLVFIPMLIGAVVYTRAEEIIRNEINRANMTVLKQLRQGFDNKLRDVEKFVFQTGLNPKIGRLMHIKTVPAGSQYYLVTQIENELRFYKTVNGFVDDFYIYFNNMDRVLSASGLSDKEWFYKYSRSYFKYFDGLSYEQWLRIIQGEFSGEYIPLERTEFPESKFNNSIIFSQSFPIGSSSKKDATLVVLLNDNRFLDDIKNITLAEDGLSLILNKNNKVLFSTEKTTEISSPSYEELTGEYGLIYEKIEDERFVISYISSSVTDWKYVLVIPLKVFHEKVEYIRNISSVAEKNLLKVNG